MYIAFEKYYKKVMKSNCTINDWKNFQLIYKKMPRISHEGIENGRISSVEIRRYWKRCAQFAEAAKHAASRLPLDDIATDSTLEFAYYELFHE